MHWAHGQVGEGFLVLGISTALGAGGAVGGLLVACSGELGCSGGDIDLRLALSVAGAGLGMLIAGIIDVAAFTYEPDPGSAVGVRVVPHFAVTSDHAVVGIAGVL